VTTIVHLHRAEDHLLGKEVYVNAAQIDMFTPNILNDAQTLIRVNGKEFIVTESVQEILAQIPEEGSWPAS